MDCSHLTHRLPNTHFPIMKSILLLICYLLLVWPVCAQQRVVNGRITDRSTGQPVPGCTILQKGTSNGVSSGSTGYFSLSVPSFPDTITLVVSSIGYMSVRRQVHPGDSTHFGLAADRKEFCDLSISPRWEAGLSAGTHYAPLGVTTRLFGLQAIPLPFQAQVSYQTNLRKNYAALVALELPLLRRYSQFTINEQLSYQQLRATPANLLFYSYSAAIRLGLYRIGGVRVPDLVVGANYGRAQRLENDHTHASYGYTVGLQRSFGYPLRALVIVKATRWPTFWQLQGSASRPVGGWFVAGVGFTQLPRYQEISLNLTRYFY